MKRIVGLDLGTNSIGWAVVNKDDDNKENSSIAGAGSRIIPMDAATLDNFAKGKRTSLTACFAHSVYGFLRAYILQLGFIDGWSGLYSSLQHFIYTMMKYLKLYELQKAKSN